MISDRASLIPMTGITGITEAPADVGGGGFAGRCETSAGQYNCWAMKNAPSDPSPQLMPDSVFVRKAASEDIDAIVAVLVEVFHETYGYLFKGTPPVPTEPDFWLPSWVADYNGKIVGVGLANRDLVNALWVLAQFRRQKVGAVLLSKVEGEIRSNGHIRARLRVVADNDGARRFYSHHGWREIRIYPHERYGHLMVDFEKNLGACE